MKYITGYFLAILIMATVVSCGTTSKVSQIDTLKSDFEQGNYQLVYNKVAAIVEKNKTRKAPSSDQVLQLATEVSLKLNKKAEARKYLEEAMLVNPKNENLYPIAAGLYKDIDNLSYEITTYENYFKHFTSENATHFNKMQIMYFDGCVRSENWETAYNLWQEENFSEKENNVDILEHYLLVCHKLDKKDDANSTADKILTIAPSNKNALLHRAFQLYTSAETRYTKQMNAYNKNKTRKQYAILLKELEAATAGFKKARDIYEPLYKKNADKTVAKYLANIYARLNNKQKSEQYKKLSK